MTETTWTATTITLSKLKPWERNPKRISKAHAARLLDLWERLGQFQTIAIGPAGEVYDGHQRLSVLKAKHGGGYVVQVLQASRPLTEAEREELTIAAHSGTTGSWDWDALAGWDVGNLTAWGLDEELLKDWNAGATALREMLAAETAPTGEDPGPQPDRAEELREKWQVEPGQVWALGEHRLICGDCTDAAVVERVMDGEKADITFTSPPYNAGKTPTEEKSGTTAKYKDYSDDLSADDYFSLLSSFTNESLSVSDYAIVNIQMLAGNKASFLRYLWAFADRLADIAIWDKQRSQPAMARNVMNSRFEFVLMFGKVGATRSLPGDFRGTVDNVYSGKPQTKNDLGAKIHAATMPIDFAEWVISNFSKKTVYEPFCGSGTTIIACERLGRRCRACEIEPSYVGVALERWATMTGQTPVLLDGAS